MTLEGQKVVLAISGVENFRKVVAGDFVISLRSFQGGIERSRYAGCVSPAYTVLRARCAINNDFWAYLLKSASFVSALNAVTEGIRDGKTVSYDQFANIVLPHPSMAEQSAIASFLDRETGRIDALVAEQERLIGLLKEKRQAVISQAVTKGLDPNVPMKDSGVEWLGEVPAHWEVKRIKNVTPSITVGIVVEPSKFYVDDGGIPALRSLNVRPMQIDLANLIYISLEGHRWHGKSRLSAGDIVVVRTGQPGTAAVVPHDLEGCNCVDLIVIRKAPNFSENFVCWYLQAEAAVRQFAEGADGAIQLHFNIGTAANIILPLPSLSEQKKIAAYLTRETVKLEKLISAANQAMILLRERRAALISAAVTGKIDVRDHADAEQAAA